MWATPVPTPLATPAPIQLPQPTYPEPPAVRIVSAPVAISVVPARATLTRPVANFTGLASWWSTE